MTGGETDILVKTFDVSKKSVLITGASSGFGEHFARVLAGAGCRNFALLARRTQRLEELASELKKKYPGIKVATVTCDVAHVEQINKAFTVAEKEVGCVFDVVINNAGIAVTKTALKTSEDEYNNVMNVNLRGCFFVATEACKRLSKAGKEGSIINIASIYGKRVGIGHAVYSATKAGLIQMTKALQVEFMRHKVRVNCICPGYFLTEINENYYATKEGDEYIEKNIPLKRLGKLTELDGALLLLSSDASSYMYGSEIVIDGGHLISSL